MKKKKFSSFCILKDDFLKGLSLVILSCAVLFFTFSSAYGADQSPDLTIKIKNENIEEAIKIISQKTGYRFIYSDDLMPADKYVSINAKNKPLTNILDQLFAGTDLQFNILNNQVVVITKTHPAKSINFPVTGTVTDEGGSPLAGVSVIIKGTSTGTITNESGQYTINASKGAILVFSYVGRQAKEVVVGDSGSIDVKLSEEQNATDLKDVVVVTALGVKRSEASTTYSTQQVSGEDLTRVKNTNVANSLSGKVAGLTISSSGSGVGGSAKVILRGAKSILGNNQALYVIDGVPMNNVPTNQPNSAYGGTTSYDGGDPISNLNPDDIESISVLKGASASALYGGDGANGVILITTKSGKAGRVQVNFSSSASFNKAAYTPSFQNAYGSATSSSLQSWGSAISGGHDNTKDFFQTGNNFTNSINLTTGSKVAQTYFSYANTSARGIEPGNDLQRNNFNLRQIGHFFDDKLTVDINANYVTQQIKNAPMVGFYFNPLTGLYLFPRGTDILTYKNQFEVANAQTPYAVQNWIGTIANNDGTPKFNDDIQQNPWWIINRNPTDLQRNRLLANASVKYDFAPWFNLQARGSVDRINDIYNQKLYASTSQYVSRSNGNYYYSNGINTQMYGDLLGNFNIPVSNDFKVAGLVGGSIRDSKMIGLYYASSGNNPGTGLFFPNIFTEQNTITDPGTSADMPQNHIQVQSAFASANLSYKEAVFLDLSGRNDWSSTLSNTKDGYSFFYPSVGANAILSKLLEMPNAISFAKIRASYAVVGLSPLAYQSNPALATIGNGGNIALNNTSPVTLLAPQKTKSFEIGTEWRFFSNRLGLDLTFYNTHTKNQTIQIQQGWASFYDNGFVVAGDVQNKGIEMMLNYNVFRGDGLNWTTGINYSVNANRVTELYPGVTEATITGQGTGANYVSKVKVGGSIGDIYGTVLQKDQQGRIMIDDTGAPIVQTGDYSYLGNANPKWQLGWNNNLSFNKFNLSFLIDGKFGGQVMSVTQMVMDAYGVSKVTGDARSAGGVTVNGVDPEGKAVTKVDAEKWYTTIGGRSGVSGEYMYSASTIRLRELSLGYMIPIRQSFIKDLRLSLTGNNLIYFYKKAPFDPELTLSTGNGLSGVDIFMPPAIRGFGINLNAHF